MANKKTEVFKSPCNFMLTAEEIGQLDKTALRLNVSRAEILRKLLKLIDKIK